MMTGSLDLPISTKIKEINAIRMISHEKISESTGPITGMIRTR